MKHQYIVCVEPVDESIAWFFLAQDGHKTYQSSLNCDWDHIPTKEEIKSILENKGFFEDYAYYVVDPIIEKTKTHEFNVRVIEQDIVSYSIDKDQDLDKKGDD